MNLKNSFCFTKMHKSNYDVRPSNDPSVNIRLSSLNEMFDQMNVKNTNQKIEICMKFEKYAGMPLVLKIKNKIQIFET